MKHLTVGICITFSLLFFGCESQKNGTTLTSKTLDTAQANIFPVHPDTFTEFGAYVGRIIPANEVKLICYDGGRVEALRAKEGDFVKTGASLAAIDSAKAILQLKTAQLQEKIAFMNLEQTKKHLKDGNASPLAVDKAELELLIAKNARIEVQKNYRGALAITPMSGIVTFRPINLYQELPPGSPTFSIAQTATMNVVFPLIESEAPLVSPGCTAEITSALYPDNYWHGTVKSIAREASTDDHTFKTEISINNPDGLLKSGSTAKVKIELRKLTNAILIPTKCIQSDGVKHSVLIVTDNNRTARRIVIIGSSSDSLTLIKEGLRDGDRVIAYRDDFIQNGVPVRIVNHK
jgi:RND family efflux transporter MFP subunit